MSLAQLSAPNAIAPVLNLFYRYVCVLQQRKYAGGRANQLPSLRLTPTRDVRHQPRTPPVHVELAPRRHESEAISCRGQGSAAGGRDARPDHRRRVVHMQVAEVACRRASAVGPVLAPHTRTHDLTPFKEATFAPKPDNRIHAACWRF